MQKTFNDKYYEAEGDQEMEVDPDLNVNLLLDKDLEADHVNLLALITCIYM